MLPCGERQYPYACKIISKQNHPCGQVITIGRYSASRACFAAHFPPKSAHRNFEQEADIMTRITQTRLRAQIKLAS